MRRRHFPGAKMMRILESAIITLSSSSGRGGQKSCTHFGGQEHSPLPFFCEGRPNNCQKSEKKQRTNKQQTVLFSRRFVSEDEGTNNKGRLLGAFPTTKKKIRRRASLLLRYSWTRKRRRQPTHNNNKKKKKVSLLPTHQTRKKEELVNKRIVVVAVVSCEKTFRSSFVPKKSIISRRRRINAREKDEQ